MTKAKTTGRNRFIIFGVIGLIILVAISFPLWRPYFVDDVVDEAFPGLSSADRDAIRDMPADEQEVLVELAAENPEMAAEHASAMMKDNTEAVDDMPEEPVVLVQGSFSFIDAVHNGEGTATIYELPDGQHVPAVG